MREINLWGVPQVEETIVIYCDLFGGGGAMSILTGTARKRCLKQMWNKGSLQLINKTSPLLIGFGG